MPPDPPRGSRLRCSYLKAPLNKYSCQYQHPSKNLSYAPDLTPLSPHLILIKEVKQEISRIPNSKSDGLYFCPTKILKS